MTEEAPKEPITIEEPSDLHGADLSSILGYDHPCITCDYNLRGLAINAACPECNNPVTDSLRRKLLRHADPVFLRHLRNGARALSIASMMPIGGLLLMIPFIIFLAGTGPRVASLFSVVAPLVYAFLMWLFFLLGWIRLTTLDPATTSGSEFDGDRSMCRKMSVVFCMLPGLLIPVVVVAVMSSSGVGLSGIMGIAIWPLVGLVVLMIQIRLGIRLVKRLALRIPSEGLRKFATALYWVIMTSIILTIVRIGLTALLVVPFISNPPTPGNQTQFPVAQIALAILLGIVSLANFFASLAGYGMYIGLFCWLWSKLSNACRLNPVVNN